MVFCYRHHLKSTIANHSSQSGINREVNKSSPSRYLTPLNIITDVGHVLRYSLPRPTSSLYIRYLAGCLFNVNPTWNLIQVSAKHGNLVCFTYCGENTSDGHCYFWKNLFQLFRYLFLVFFLTDLCMFATAFKRYTVVHKMTYGPSCEQLKASREWKTTYFFRIELNFFFL